MPDLMGPTPLERRLGERPQDRAAFNDVVTWLQAASRPGEAYRVPFWASPARRREMRRSWEKMTRIIVGRAYELGRQP